MVRCPCFRALIKPSSSLGLGISASTGRPFSPPTAFRTIERTNVGKLEKSELMQGRCHKCKKWVAVEGVKDVPTKVRLPPRLPVSQYHSRCCAEWLTFRGQVKEIYW